MENKNKNNTQVFQPSHLFFTLLYLYSYKISFSHPSKNSPYKNYRNSFINPFLPKFHTRFIFHLEKYAPYPP
jgi:hypothetical protein